jgi:uncharacterized protein (DUF58 family)
MNILPVLVAILLLAFATGSESLSYLAYFLAGLVLLSRFWVPHAARSLAAVRRFPPRAFFGEEVRVELEVLNRGRLPIPWLVIHESLPSVLRTPSIERRVVSLSAHEKTVLHYDLSCRRRGYYRLGPLSLRSGDLLSLAPDWEGRPADDSLIVYPQIIPLPKLQLPSQIPFGDLPTQTRFFEDPSRFFGLRDYQPGDSLRSVSWKNSARLSSLQVKRFQPAVALRTAVFLDLNCDSYALRSRPSAEDVGCTIAASIAARLLDLRQQVGLTVVGKDDMTGYSGLLNLPSARGREHLMRILEVLARARMESTEDLVTALPRASADWGSGTSVVVITSGGHPSLVDCCLQIHRRGFSVMLIATDAQVQFRTLQTGLATVGVPAHRITRHEELDLWR